MPGGLAATGSVLLLGLLATAASLVLMVQPRLVPSLARLVLVSRWRFAAALAGLLAGALLIGAAPPLAASQLVAWCGWLLALLALLLVTLPPTLLRRLADRLAGLPAPAHCLWLLPPLALGLLLSRAALD